MTQQKRIVQIELSFPHVSEVHLFNLNAIGVSDVPMPENAHDQTMSQCVIASRARYKRTNSHLNPL
jgi:hypothetical protein